MPSRPTAPLRVLGRYALYGELAAGGMATVHFGRLIGPVGFSRTVAIKRLHPQFAKDPEFVSMFLDEARLAARIRHPNVVQTLDVVAASGELFLVMEYVEGESLSRLLHATSRAGLRLPVSHAVAILSGALYGLHAAHEAMSERGEPLGLVHRDMSPQNVLVGADGVPRVLDFGVAKAAGRLQTTREGQLKGKMAYMAPEQLQGGKVDRRSDLFAAGVVLWEALTGVRLFKGDSDAEVFGKVLYGDIPPPSSQAPDIPPALDAILAKALARAPGDRFESAHAMARALERSAALVPASEVAEFVAKIASRSLAARAERVAEIEGASSNPNASAPARDERDDSAPHPGTRVVARDVPASLGPVEGLDPPTLTQLSSGSISQPRLGAPRPRLALIGLAVVASTAVLLIAVLSLGGRSEAPAPATVWTEPAPTTAPAAVAPAGTSTAPVDTAPAPSASVSSATTGAPAAPTPAPAPSPTASHAAPPRALPPRPPAAPRAAPAPAPAPTSDLSKVLDTRR